MRPNAYQKTLILVFLILLVFLCVFFLPFTIKQEIEVNYNDYKTVYSIAYGPIWQAEGIISTSRLIIELFALFVLSGGLFYFLGTIRVSNHPFRIDSSAKKAIKRELKFVILSIAILAGAYLYHKIYNYYNADYADYRRNIYASSDIIYNLRSILIVILVVLFFARYIYYYLRREIHKQNQE